MFYRSSARDCLPFQNKICIFRLDVPTWNGLPRESKSYRSYLWLWRTLESLAQNRLPPSSQQKIGCQLGYGTSERNFTGVTRCQRNVNQLLLLISLSDFFSTILSFSGILNLQGYEERSPISALCKSSISMKTVSLVWASLLRSCDGYKRGKKGPLNSCVRNTPRILFLLMGKQEGRAKRRSSFKQL